MTPDTLVVLLGDSPRMPTGLGRIAGDLAAHLHNASERLGIHFLQVGWEYGRPALQPVPWQLVTFPEIGQDWGASQVLPLVAETAGQLGLSSPREVVILSVWDPARCFEYRLSEYPLWGYFAVDGHNRKGSFGGPAADTVQCYDRVLGYTEYGAKVLHEVLRADDVSDAVPYLPHGHYWDAAQWLRAEENVTPPQQGYRIGCVATNQPRKDLGLFFATIAELRAGGERVYGWLHTDQLVTGAWSIPELMEVYNLQPDWVQITTPPASTEWLQLMYASCAVTLAPGRGEGFGYPIVESYAMGRPVVHCDYGGGRELTLPEGRVVPESFDTTNPYCLQRPVLRVEDVASRCAELAGKMLVDPTLPAYYAGSVAHLHWKEIWPRWETWLRQGLQELRRLR